MKHCIIVKFNEDFNWKNNLDDIKNIFNETLNIEGITKIDYLLSNSDIKNRSDLVIAMTMNKEALEIYKTCKPHILWKEKYGPHISSKAIFDYDE